MRPTARLYRDVPIPMRDGVALRADIWAPEHGRGPVLLERLPYDKSLSLLTTVEAGLEPARAVAAGYAVVVQDTRGRFASDGHFDPYVHEGEDGIDTIEWCANLPFSDGRVAMFGASYFGTTQLLAAAAAPPALGAIAPTVTGSDVYEGWTYQGGAFQLGFALSWVLPILAPDIIARLPEDDRGGYEALLADALENFDDTCRRLPLSDLGGLEAILPFYGEWLQHPTDDAYWQSRSPTDRYASIETPALHIGGWYDIFIAGTVENFSKLRRTAATERARRGQRLVIGPWAHGNFNDTIGELPFGPGSSKASLDTTALLLRFFDEHLRSQPSAEPPVRIFLMGANRWLEEDDWPPARSQSDIWYLHSDGRANTARGDGRLSRDRCGATEPPDVYLYDPHNPVPTVGGTTFLPGAAVSHNAGPRDQRTVEDRRDVLVFTSEPLPHDLDVIGPVRVRLSVSSSAVDSDFTAKLVDVHPDERAMIICDGIASLRHARSKESVSIELGPTAMRFEQGHRIRLDVSSSNFPRFARNPNNGVSATRASVSDFQNARQQVFHAADRPSSLELTVRR